MEVINKMHNQKLELILEFFNDSKKTVVQFPSTEKELIKALKKLKLQSIRDLQIRMTDIIPQKIRHTIYKLHTFNRNSIIEDLQTIGFLFDKINNISNGPVIFEALLELNDPTDSFLKVLSNNCLFISDVNKSNIEDHIMYKKLRFDVSEFIFVNDGALYCPKNIDLLKVRHQLKNSIPVKEFPWNKVIGKKSEPTIPGLTITFKANDVFDIDFPCSQDKWGDILRQNNLYSLTSVDAIKVSSGVEIVDRYVKSMFKNKDISIDKLQIIGYLMRELKYTNLLNKFANTIKSDQDVEFIAIKTLLPHYNEDFNKFEIMQLIEKQLVDERILKDSKQFIDFLDKKSIHDKREY